MYYFLEELTGDNLSLEEYLKLNKINLECRYIDINKLTGIDTLSSSMEELLNKVANNNSIIESSDYCNILYKEDSDKNRDLIVPFSLSLSYGVNGIAKEISNNGTSRRDLLLTEKIDLSRNIDHLFLFQESSVIDALLTKRRNGHLSLVISHRCDDIKRKLLFDLFEKLKISILYNILSYSKTELYVEKLIRDKELTEFYFLVLPVEE